MQCQTVLEIFTVSPSFHRKVKREHEGHSVMSDCDLTDCSPPGSSVHGILQARILEWVATPFSRGSPRPRDQTRVSHLAGRFFTIWATREALSAWQVLNTHSRLSYTLTQSKPRLLMSHKIYSNYKLHTTCEFSATICYTFLQNIFDFAKLQVSPC